MYKHIFFDLDRTLWDFETNSRAVMHELAVKYDFSSRGIKCVNTFIDEYFKINEVLWAEYRDNKIDKETLRYDRFYRALALYNIHDKELGNEIGNYYMDTAPSRTALFPGTCEVLSKLSSKYQLHIITNGFEDSQRVKMTASGLNSYFKEVITSERAGFKKPDKRIFEYSLNAAKADPSTSLMIGDCLIADISGAEQAGLHQVFFNPAKVKHESKPTYEVHSLPELLNFL